MKLYKYLLFILIAGYYSAVSQSLIIERTDINNDTSKFVTATYNFSFNILLEGVPNSNSVAFKLNYNLPEFVKFSQWKQGDYNVLQVVNLNNDDGTASLIVGVSSGLEPVPAHITMPKVIELEFTVVKNTPNHTNLFMNFELPKATAINLDTGVAVALNAESLNYRVHSYINVWPGDSDNSGEVDHLDFVPVSQYIGIGSISKGIRTFKRQTSSALWTPQRVLTWDSSIVTFADCDGNAEITTSDMLIVTYNLGKDTLNPYGTVDNDSTSKVQEPKVVFSENNADVYFLDIASEFPFISAAGTVELEDENCQFVGLNNGSVISDDYYIHSFKNSNLIHFVIASKNKLHCQNLSGTLAKFIFKKDFNDIKPIIKVKELNAIDNLGNVFNLNNKLTNVFDNNINEEISISNHQSFLNISSQKDISECNIYDLLGSEIKNYTNNRNNINISFENQNNGLYLLNIRTINKNYFYKVMIIENKIYFIN